MKLKKGALAFAAAIGFMTLSSVAQAGWGDLKPINVWDKIKKEIAKQEIGAGVTLINAEILDGISTSLRYRIESEPSYVDGYYTRFDRYQMRIKIDPSDYIEELDGPLGLRLEKNSEIIFARQFKNQKESLLSLPYTMKHLPLTAEKAVTRLVPGDFVAFQGRMAFVLSLGHDALAGDFNLGASTHAYISGEFMVHLFRMPDNKMRVKLIGVRGKGVGANAGADLSDDLEILGISIFDNKIERWLNLTPMDLRTNLGKHNVIMLDYVFDLNNPQAAQAYDSMMLHKVQLKDIKISNPNATRADLTREVLTNLVDVEEIALEDAHLAPELRRIDRLFKGSTEGITRDNRIKFGFNLWKFESERAYGQNKVLSYDKNDAPHKFILDTFTRYQKTRILFGLYGEENLMSTNVLFSATDDWVPHRFITTTVTHEMKMKDFSKKDFREIQRMVRETLGDEGFRQIDWKKWDFSKNPVNAYFKQEVFFNPHALMNLIKLGRGSIAKSFEDYISKKGPSRALPTYGAQVYNLNVDPQFLDFTPDSQEIAKNLVVIMSPYKSVQERFDAFLELQKISIWRERGAGFLMSFIPLKERARLLKYTMTLTAKDAPIVDYSYGQFTEEKLYRSLMYIQNIINDRGFDLRFFENQNRAVDGLSSQSVN